MERYGGMGWKEYWLPLRSPGFGYTLWMDHGKTGPKWETEPGSSSALGLGSAWERPQKAKGYMKEAQPAPCGLRREEGLDPIFIHHPPCLSKPWDADQEGPWDSRRRVVVELQLQHWPPGGANPLSGSLLTTGGAQSPICLPNSVLGHDQGDPRASDLTGAACMQSTPSGWESAPVSLMAGRSSSVSRPLLVAYHPHLSIEWKLDPFQDNSSLPSSRKQGDKDRLY